MTFYYQPMREYRNPGERRVELRVCKPGDKPEMHSVYRRGLDGTSEWVADFAAKAHAIEFVAKMEGSNNRSFTVGYLCALREVGLFGCVTYDYLLALCGQIVDNPEVLEMVREELS